MALQLPFSFPMVMFDLPRFTTGQKSYVTKSYGPVNALFEVKNDPVQIHYQRSHRQDSNECFNQKKYGFLLLSTQCNPSGHKCL